MQNIYTVYLHMNLKNKKRYYGLTRLDVEDRWKNGYGYIQNKKFYDDIQKYGWDGFLHKVIATDLNYYEARQLEHELIYEYDTVNNGYNQELPNLAEKYNFKYFDFKIFNHDMIQKNNYQYFIKIPNIFIQTNLKKEFNINRIFYFVWIAISRNKTLESISYITIEEIFNMCHYKVTKHRPKIFSEIIKCLCFLNENCYIQCDIDPFDISYKTRIEIYVVEKYFNPTEKYTIITKNQLDTIINFPSNVAVEQLLTVFLYINSCIGCRKRKEDGSDFEDASNYPEACWQSLDNMTNEIGMSKSTLTKCIDYLISNEFNQPALFIKRKINNAEDGFIKTVNALPSIYVLNKEGYEKELEYALQKLKKACYF